MDIESKKAAGLAAARERVGLPADGVDPLVGTWRKYRFQPKAIYRVEGRTHPCVGEYAKRWMGSFATVSFSKPFYTAKLLASDIPATPREVLDAKLATLKPEQRARVEIRPHAVVVDGVVTLVGTDSPDWWDERGHDAEIDAMLAAIDAALAKPAPQDRPPVGSVHPWPVARADMEAQPEARWTWSFEAHTLSRRIKNGSVEKLLDRSWFIGGAVDDYIYDGTDWRRLPDDPTPAQAVEAFATCLEKSTQAEGDTPAEPHKSEASTTDARGWLERQFDSLEFCQNYIKEQESEYAKDIESANAQIEDLKAALAVWQTQYSRRHEEALRAEIEVSEFRRANGEPAAMPRVSPVGELAALTAERDAPRERVRELEGPRPPSLTDLERAVVDAAVANVAGWRAAVAAEANPGLTSGDMAIKSEARIRFHRAKAMANETCVVMRRAVEALIANGGE